MAEQQRKKRKIEDTVINPEEDCTLGGQYMTEDNKKALISYQLLKSRYGTGQKKKLSVVLCSGL